MTTAKEIIKKYKIKTELEKSFSDFNWTLGFYPINRDESPDFRFYKLSETFNLIREYL